MANSCPKSLVSLSFCTFSKDLIVSSISLMLDRSMENAKSAEFPTPAAEAAKLTVNQQHLKTAWDTSQTSTKDDWNDWIHRLTVELMKESPSHALRACMSLVDIHSPLARESTLR